MDPVRQNIAQQIGELFIVSAEMAETIRRKDAEIAALRQQVETPTEQPAQDMLNSR